MSNEPANRGGQWSIFDRLFDAVIIIDRVGRLYYANQSFQALSDVRASAIQNHENARDYIELPEECWAPLVEVGGGMDPSARYREVGFITKSGSLGRAQVYTGIVAPEGLLGTEMSDKEFYSLVIRDVSIEDRLHAKYKFQIEANEHLKVECERVIVETQFLREIMTDLAPYNEKSEMLDIVSARLKTEIGCREVHFFHLNDETGAVESIGLERRIDGRTGEVITQLEPILKDFRGETVRSAMLRPQGQAWITFCRPRLDRTTVMVVCPRMASKPHELRAFFEAFAVQLSVCFDNRAYFFEPQVDAMTALPGRRFFNSRLQIECQRATEKHTALSFLLIEVNAHAQGGDPVETFKTVGQAIKRRLRATDFVARVSDSQYGLLLPDTSEPGALLVAESLRHVVGGGVSGVVLPTFTCGIAEFNWSSDNAQSFFERTREVLVTARAEQAAKAA